MFAETTLMGTSMSINVWLGTELQAKAAGTAIRDAFGDMARLEAIASEWQSDSDLSRLNANAGGPAIPIPEELFEILNRSRTISEATRGRFDVTFYAVGSLWHFDPGSQPPRKEAIAAVLSLVDWRDIELDKTQHTARLRRPGMKVGLGAIAKGYAVDRASQLLAARGFRHHIVEGGGDTYVSGTKDGKPWQVGIKDPGGGGTLAALPMQDKAVVTSGTYERYFEYKGQQYTHILDPDTGWPIRRELSPTSVTVVASNATDADAYATAIMVMGSEVGLRFAEDHPDLEALIVRADGRMVASSGLRDVVRSHLPLVSAAD